MFSSCCVRIILKEHFKMGADTEKEAGKHILKSYGEFFRKQHQELLLVTENEKWEDNKTYLPIQVIMEWNEILSINELLSSDNILMTKVLSVLSSLCVEVMELKKEAFERHFPFLAVYEEYRDCDISAQMHAICSLSAFVTRCDDTLRNLCSQVFGVFTEVVVNINGIQLHYIIKHIGEIFTILVILEQLISMSSLPSHWNKYCKTLKAFSHMPDKFNIFEDKIKAIITATENITSKIMNDDIVQTSLQNLLILRKNLVDKSSSTLTTEFTQYLRQAITNLDKMIQDKPNGNNMYKCIKVNTLFVLTSYLFGTMDKKIFKSLIDLNTKAHSINLIGTTVWYPEQFLQRHVPSLCASHGKLSQTMLKARQTYISNKKTSLHRDITNLHNSCNQWVLNMEELFSSQNHKLSATEMNLHTRTLLDGLELISTINYSLLTLINLHLSLGVPLSRNILMSLFEIINMMKSLQNAVSRNYNQIINSINMVIQHLIFQATSSIQDVKKSVMAEKNFANKRLDEFTCIVIAEQALKGTPTIDRNIAANIALSFVPNTTYIDDSYIKLGTILEKVQTLSNFIKSFEEYCNCAWILWHQNVIPIYYEQNFNTQLNVLKLRYFFMVLEDCAMLLHVTDKLYSMEKSQKFLMNMQNLMDEKLIKSTGQNIETNLRLHIHSHLQLDAINPFEMNMTKKLLLTIDTFRILTIYMCVVPSVEHYLSTMYYNLTTVVLSDWKTYGEMRQMANFKFNLKTVQDNLPTQTLEQGLDVLEIMRNIHIFVSKYLYNLNNQIFIEKSSNNKHLNSINIKHIANSIRTHGTGIMNTTVNFTYQFLKKKFFTFSQFMYDEHIKSRLIKDLRNFKETSPANNGMYHYKYAEKFNKGIKVLGLDDDGQSYLDLFRELISQIGNAMGYVRMIRSGGRHCCSDATVFLSNLENTASFKDLCIDNKLGSKTINASENLDHNINDLISNFIQGTEYFKLLVDVFAPVFRNPKNVHLKNFYIIVPPLTLNFIEHMILSKDKMTKKNKVGAAFTDDGFAMGVAYILKLLDQDCNFESLHWFESVWKHIQDERNLVEDQKNKGSVQLQQALALTEKKLKTVEQEYKLLYYSLTSARIFFR
ncbi:WASH complex subunit 4 isoform X2 [Galleria mellonella]|uniref:WASH complex subunit 4 isoform X2 n=1 Tax=Galleria mellonella TaxID=7137 RepID=A0A6J3BR57_GALME|nr:WASH complex subunit 4 isoform X2 [Galleria mellonella]XP_052756226.1 WASH complex subunit 4 isoform X2 [Galleria mellonella]